VDARRTDGARTSGGKAPIAAQCANTSIQAFGPPQTSGDVRFRAAEGHCRHGSRPDPQRYIPWPRRRATSTEIQLLGKPKCKSNPRAVDA
jgi:hypothetical protein